MDALFCKQCKSILDIPADEDFISCSVCGERQDASVFEGAAFVTKSRANAFTHSLKKRMQAAASVTKAGSGATIKERCPKCNHPEMTFHTMQLRSADEGQTVFYACPKCHYKYMFALAVVTDSIRIHPKSSQSCSLLQSVTDSLNSRFCNRVISGVGLVLKVFDVLELEEPIIHAGESHSSVKAKFRLMVFKPFVGEVLIGKIRSCTEEGLSISLTFFDDILIPAHCLQPGTTFNHSERLWVWNYDGNELFMDLEEPIRFRVLAQNFTETAPVQKEALLAAVANKMNGIGEIGKQEEELAGEAVHLQPPFKIIATVAEDGLGLLSWWN